ncbi:phage tail tape measure protein [Rathayibacter sp. AY1C1]|uniref:phage tail tape measure protein n=1 Tax=Rathayibacter sp. AY1C1 TaxID=2080534 RepID=UPI000CE890B2|nr:phage tail tape measure protein [Rathayibacter sp. AY1C1]PPH11633.1 phage tail tape measure protein [Rathayibacter sp. AY1C1]
MDDSGFAAEQARLAMDNLKGDVDALGGSLETALIKSGSTANGTLRALTQTATGLINGFNDLPAPIQGTAFTLTAVAAATGLAGGAALIAVPKIAAMKVAMADLNVSAGKLGRGIALVGGAITAVSAGLAIVGQHYADVSANAEALTGTLDQQTGAFTDSTRAMVVGILQQKGAYGDAARAAGISQKELTDAILEGGSALEEVQSKLSAENTLFSFFDGTGIAAGNASAAIGDVEKSLDKSVEGYRNAKAANEGLTEASDGSAESATTAAEAYITEADSVDQLVSRMTELLDAVNKANGVNQDAVSQNIAYQQSLSDVDAQIQKARDGVEGYSLGLDTNTQAGRDNYGMLLEVAKNGQAAAKAQFDATGRTDEYRTALENSRQAVYDRALALTGNAEAAQAIADNIAAIPSETDWKVIAETATAQRNVDNFVRTNNGRSITITVNEALGERVARGPGGAGGIVATSANGNMFDYVMSATARATNALAFANGGFAPGIYAGRTESIHKFAEPETRWEAYISGKPGQEARNIAIWEEAGKRLSAFESIDPRTLSPMPAHYSTSTVDNSRTVAPTVSLGSGNTFYSYDPTEMARQQTREMNRALTLSGLR